MTASAPLIRGLLRLATWAGPEKTERALRGVARALAPFLRHNRIAVANIAAAFPDKSPAERKEILRGTWDNFVRVIVEYLFPEAMLEAIAALPSQQERITISGLEYFEALRDDDHTGVIFSAHLANWELLAVVAHHYGLKAVIPFRPVRNAQIAEDLIARRRSMMGNIVDNARGSAFELAAAMERGEHLGFLVDQRLNRGIPVPFFGRMALTNPLAARLARQFDCPVHGARAIRRPGGRLHLELTPPLDMPRDAEGRIDVAAATARMTEIVEGWVREYPEQWFWLHDRWRT